MGQAFLHLGVTENKKVKNHCQCHISTWHLVQRLVSCPARWICNWHLEFLHWVPYIFMYRSHLHILTLKMRFICKKYTVCSHSLWADGHITWYCSSQVHSKGFIHSGVMLHGCLTYAKSINIWNIFLGQGRGLPPTISHIKYLQTLLNCTDMMPESA